MTSAYCTWCRNQSSMLWMSAASPRIRENSESSGPEAHAAFKCSHCGAISVGILPRSVFTQAKQIVVSEAVWNENNASIAWEPKLLEGKDFEDVPNQIADAAGEAHRCRSAEAFRASILLARGVVEAVAKDKGVDKGNLAAKIASLESQGFVRRFTREAADEIRHLGNDMAHGDYVEPADKQDCDAVLAVMDEILDEVYQGPARVSRMKRRRAANGLGTPESDATPL